MIFHIVFYKTFVPICVGLIGIVEFEHVFDMHYEGIVGKLYKPFDAILGPYISKFNQIK